MQDVVGEQMDGVTDYAHYTHPTNTRLDLEEVTADQSKPNLQPPYTRHTSLPPTTHSRGQKTPNTTSILPRSGFTSPINTPASGCMLAPVYPVYKTPGHFTIEKIETDAEAMLSAVEPTTKSSNTAFVHRSNTVQRIQLNDRQWEKYFIEHTDPSIRTVEASANAKVFLETYFDALQSRISSRHERRRELEYWLQNPRITPTAKEKYRLEWFAKESGHLRKSRKLKIRSRCMTLCHKDARPGGFEILRALGKGSFGTVCLVRERPDVSEMDIWSSRLSLESRAISDQQVENANKKIKRYHFFRNNRSLDQIESITRPEPSPIYAMKVIRKNEMLRNAQEGHIRAERDFLVASAKSIWVVDLIASFQDKANLFLVMEYMIGGDFLSLLIKHDTLNEKRTRWYIAEIIMCVEAVHSLKWIHRDVKPDNFLISSSGHLKIADFGLAFDGHWSHDQNYYHAQRYSVLQKLNIPLVGDGFDFDNIQDCMRELSFDERVYLTQREKEATLRHDPVSAGHYSHKPILQWRDESGRRAFARSLVGTSQYMAPEVVSAQEYDGRCDWWSVSVILFECLYGHTPFISYDRDATKEMIVSHAVSLKIPPESKKRSYQQVSKSAIDLMRALLTSRESRLSSYFYTQNDSVFSDKHARKYTSPVDTRSRFVYTNDACDIKKHKFFSNINWSRLHLERAPLVPSVKGRADTKYFDQEPISVELDLDRDTSSEVDEEAAQSQFQHLDGYRNDVDLRTRPRDRILRDQVYRRDAMKLRKQDAFLGYTYKQPPQVRPFVYGIAC